MSYNPHMRRRWTLLVAFGAVALFAGPLFLLPSRDDGLDWIRKYGLAAQGEITVSEPGANGAPGVTRQFTFAQIPHEFESDLRRRMVWSSRAKNSPLVVGMLPGGWHVSYPRNSTQVHLFRFDSPNWFQKQLAALKRRFGYGN